MKNQLFTIITICYLFFVSYAYAADTLFLSDLTDNEKVVFIASVGAYNTNFPMPAGGKSNDDTFDENDTPFMSEESHPYAQAKFIANQTVEKFIMDHPDAHFEITSVSPTGVMGKSLSDRADSTSSGLQFLFMWDLGRIQPIHIVVI